MPATDLALSAHHILPMALGLVVFLLPGLALADRMFGPGWGLVTAPVLSFSSVGLTLILLDFAAGVPLRSSATFASCLAIAILAGLPRIRSWWAPRQPKQRPPAKTTAWRPTWRFAATATGIAAAVLLVALVAYLPHMPGDADDESAWLDLGARTAAAAQGDDYPYPVHVDEHMHMAFLGAMERQEKVAIDAPYTGSDTSGTFFSVPGFRAERGFTVALLEIVHLTGVPMGALFRFLPAIWTGYTALLLYAALRSQPGAAASAAALIITPTTVRHLGPGILIPGVFGLAWIVAILHTVTKAQGPARFFGIMLLVTAGMFIHLVVGTVTIITALLTILVGPMPRSDRIALAIATLVPLAWILPSIWDDVVAAVAGVHSLAFEVEVFLTPGIPLYALAAVGAFTAWMRPDAVPQRALSLLATGLAASMGWSVAADHSNDATYTRIMYPFFLSVAALAGFGLWSIVVQARRGIQAIAHRRSIAKGRRRMLQATPAVVAVLLLAGTLSTPLDARLDTPYYRIHNEASWQAAADFEASGAGPDDRFLSEPWRAPVYNAVTGARPHAVLYPGSAPHNGTDWVAYVRSGGAEVPEGMDYVIGPPPPVDGNLVAGDVYRSA